MRKKLLFAAVIISILLLAACGNNPDAEADEDALETKSLSVLAHESYIQAVRSAETSMALDARLLPPDERFNFSVELTAYSHLDRDAQQQRLQVAMMAGQAYDIFFLDRHPLLAFAQSGFLTDIYTLIDADPTTNRDDFFSQPLTALEIDGGLYTFPASFGFSYVFINADLPESIVDRFLQHKSITFLELIGIYIDLMQEYGAAYDHMNFTGGSSRFAFMPSFVLHHFMSGFIDVENQTANLTDIDFINFLNAYNQILQGYWQWDRDSFWTADFPRALHLQAGEYAFWIASALRDPGYAFFDAQPYFIHGIPLADDDGRLIMNIEDSWANICITASADGALAWEYTKYLLSTFDQLSALLTPENRVASYSTFQMQLTSPITQDLFSAHMPGAFDRFISWMPSQYRDPIANDIYYHKQQTENAIVRLAALNEMPVALSTSFVPDHLIQDDFELFSQGAMTAEDFAQQLQNRVLLWLIE